VSFKYGKIALKKINHRKYKNHQNVDVGNILRSFSTSDVDKLEKLIFNFQEENKDALYSEIYVYLRNGERKIGDEEKLKFIIFYSLEKDKNLLEKDFKNGFLFWDRKNEKDDQERSFKIVGDLFNKLSDYSEAVILFKAVDFFPKYLNHEYYLLDSDVALEQEKIPEFFQKEENNNYLKTYRKFGLNVDETLPIVRRKITNCEELKRDEIKKISQKQIINTLEFFSNKNYEYSIDDSDIYFQNLKTLFNSLDRDYFKTLSFLPILSGEDSFKIRKPLRWICITSKQLKSKNKFFQSRLSEEIQSEKIIYFNLLGLDSIPHGWNLVEENEEEKKAFREKNAKDINMTISSKTSSEIERNWAIGHKGEDHVFNVLKKRYCHFGDEVIWNNHDATSIDEDTGKVDIVLVTKGETHYIEVKTTTESVKTDNVLRFFMSNKQFIDATSWGRDKHLIFVVGINDEPKLLYFNFNNEWLDSF
jgi:hypothetical protein